MALLLMDAAANALCLCMMLRLMGMPFKGRRAAFGALCGALLALGFRLTPPQRLPAAAFWLPSAMLLARIACGRWSLRAAVVLLASYGLLGGTVMALAGAAGSLRAGWLAGALAVCLMTGSAVRAGRAACDVTRVKLTVTVHGCCASFEAIADSGNCLRDYLTHRPVIVLPEAAKARLSLRGAALRPIFADTAGGRQMMDCLTPERIQIDAKGKTRCVRACVAFSPGLSQNAPALVPQSLFAQQENRETEGEFEESSEEGDSYGVAEG